jgi:hypothetical protein
MSYLHARVAILFFCAEFKRIPSHFVTLNNKSIKPTSSTLFQTRNSTKKCNNFQSTPVTPKQFKLRPGEIIEWSRYLVFGRRLNFHLKLERVFLSGGSEVWWSICSTGMRTPRIINRREIKRSRLHRSIFAVKEKNKQPVNWTSRWSASL